LKPGEEKGLTVEFIEYERKPRLLAGGGCQLIIKVPRIEGIFRKTVRAIAPIIF
jgi:hypothetical protein